MQPVFQVFARIEAKNLMKVLELLQDKGEVNLGIFYKSVRISREYLFTAYTVVLKCVSRLSHG